MPAPRGRQITNFGGFLDPFAVGSSSFQRVLVQPDNVRVTTSLEEVTLTKSVLVIPADLQVNSLLEQTTISRLLVITPEDLLVFTSLGYSDILKKAFTIILVGMPSATIRMEMPSGTNEVVYSTLEITTENPSADLRTANPSVAVKETTHV